jgi:hypothetical protein
MGRRLNSDNPLPGATHSGFTQPGKPPLRRDDETSIQERNLSHQIPPQGNRISQDNRPPRTAPPPIPGIKPPLKNPAWTRENGHPLQQGFPPRDETQRGFSADENQSHGNPTWKVLGIAAGCILILWIAFSQFGTEKQPPTVKPGRRSSPPPEIATQPSHTSTTLADETNSGQPLTTGAPANEAPPSTTQEPSILKGLSPLEIKKPSPPPSQPQNVATSAERSTLVKDWTRKFFAALGGGDASALAEFLPLSGSIEWFGSARRWDDISPSDKRYDAGEIEVKMGGDLKFCTCTLPVSTTNTLGLSEQTTTTPHLLIWQWPDHYSGTTPTLHTIKLNGAPKSSVEVSPKVRAQARDLASRFFQNGNSSSSGTIMQLSAMLADPLRYFDQPSISKSSVLDSISSFRSKWPVRTFLPGVATVESETGRDSKPRLLVRTPVKSTFSNGPLTLKQDVVNLMRIGADSSGVLRIEEIWHESTPASTQTWDSEEQKKIADAFIRDYFSAGENRQDQSRFYTENVTWRFDLKPKTVDKNFIRQDQQKYLSNFDNIRYRSIEIKYTNLGTSKVTATVSFYASFTNLTTRVITSDSPRVNRIVLGFPASNQYQPLIEEIGNR